MNDASRLRLAALARDQLGLATRQQILGCGVGATTIHRRTAAGEWERLERGVLRVAPVPDSWEQRALAACLSVGPQAVLSHFAAARAWELEVHRVRWIDVTLPGDAPHRTSTAGIRVHRARRLGADARTTRSCLPVTSVWRTVQDLAAHLHTADLERLLDHVVARELVRPAALEEILGRPQRGRRGTASLRKAAEPWVGRGRVESFAEMRALRLIAQAGLPAPKTQFRVLVGAQTVARLDFAWPAQHLGLEVDGYRFHSSRRDYEADRARDRALSGLGWRILRCTPGEIETSPHHVVESLARVLAS